MPFEHPNSERNQTSAGDDIRPLVGVLSHDLGANLMLLESSLRRLQKSCSDRPLDALADDFAQVDACLRQSKRFLEDLRLLGRAGHIRFDPTRLDLDAVVRDVLVEQAPLLAERRIDAQIVAPLPAVWCHETRAKQVLTNLVRNAALHGCDRRSPKIRISAEISAAPDPGGHARRATPAWAWIRVEDNGPGVPENARQAIFLPGTRLQHTPAGGSGLGLWIVHEIVGHYGGSAWIDGDAPGAAFVFSLPAAVGTPAGVGPPAPHLFQPSGLESAVRELM